MDEQAMNDKMGIMATVNRQMSTSIVVSVLIAAMLAAALWPHTATAPLAWWLVSLCVLSLLRLASLSPQLPFSRNRHLQTILTAAAGVTWGTSAPLFLPTLDPHHQMLVILVLIGIVASSSNAYAGRMELFYAFTLPLLILPCIWLFAQNTEVYMTLGGMDLLYILSLSIFARRNTRLLQLSMAKNEQLETEIGQREAHEYTLGLQRAILDAIARHSGNLNALLTTITQQVENERPGMFASVLLLDETGKRLQTGAAPSLPDAWNAAVDGEEIGPKAGSCGTAAFLNERVIVTDIAIDPLWESYREAARAFNLSACWSEPVRDAAGEVLGTFAMYYNEPRCPTKTDIDLIENIASLTSIAIENCRKKDQLAASRQHESELAAMVEHSSDMIYAHDLGGTIITANTTCTRNFGGDIIGRNINTIIVPEEAEKVRSMMAQKAEQGGSTVYELTVMDSEGNRHILEINSNLILRNDKPIAVQGVARDITRRKQAEAMMTLLEQAIHASDESIMILDAKGRIEFANPAAASLYKYPATELIGTSIARLRGGHEGDDTYRAIVSTITSGENWAGEMSFHPAGGLKTVIARRVSPIMDEMGHVHHQICIDRDITAEKKQNEQLEHTQRLESLGILAGGIAHDFNNLLTAIMGNAAIAERKMDNSVSAKPYLARIEESSQRAADLCKQMLAYSGKGRFIVKPVNLSHLIEEMTRLMEVSIEKNIVIRYELNDQLPLIDADRAQIQQVILNLITNANEAIGEKRGMISFVTGTMHVDRAYLESTINNDTLSEGEYVYMEVSDNGCGMNAATMEKMFDPFFTTKFTGRGLGMSAMLGIIRGHHGAIRVYSEPGQGTTFKVLLPTSSCQRVPGQSPSGVDPDWQGRGTVLVVDDEATIREVATAMLEEMGFDTITATDGEEAVGLYRRHGQKIVLVLLDLTMPKMDGKACLAELLCINPDVKVILSSGYNEEETGEQFAFGILAGFIQKPYSPEALQQVIRHSLTD
ncbi:PAS domain S-box protein [Mariprofundus ferrooxydans]|uniref:hybrid sensor histidine kinase/response regulator n=1 Tax=Mariprofundus ferrooxydans TaxID=314344 RepID=UPI00037972C6|nr:PAS domain S-box protein [Mariprofundus ferrooxydans]